jgi:hypothetical protein
MGNPPYSLPRGDHIFFIGMIAWKTISPCFDGVSQTHDRLTVSVPDHDLVVKPPVKPVGDCC